MARRVLKAIAVLLVLVILSLTIQRITAATRYSKICSPACHLEVRGTRKPLEMEAKIGEDDAVGDDYDVYRRHGDVPSPGIGH
ncbi:hypothetical protein FCV25MIE_03611 [Fagus crenata]|jgi:hypothetical protein|uniref:Uncharacterized protein n=1 Tax=Fagus sylvatica TaxID=28930 RepID=A0A2N9EHX7_FAGSY